MAVFTRLIRFESTTPGEILFADIQPERTSTPTPGIDVRAYPSFEDLKARQNGRIATIGKLLAPTPNPEVPIYCVGLNYRSHAAEAKLDVPRYPPLWTKPRAALANPSEDIPINKFCADSLLDYEGELVFITSRECRDISPSEAQDYILGYTAGNDLSCRAFQHPSACGSQFFFAKAFDKFAPMGPVLLSAEEFDKYAADGVRMTTRVNGEELQSAQCPGDLVFKPGEILSHMSQGTTIPAFTAVMTGTPAGVGLFRNNGTFLRNGDVVEVEIKGVGVLENKVVFV